MSQQQKWKFQVASHLLKWMKKIHFVFIAREVWSLWTPFPKSLHSSLHPHTTTKHSLPTPQIPGTALPSHKQALLQKPTLLSPTTPCPSWCNHLPCLSLMANLYTRLQLLNFSSGKRRSFWSSFLSPFLLQRGLHFFFFFFSTTELPFSCPTSCLRWFSCYSGLVMSCTEHLRSKEATTVCCTSVCCWSVCEKKAQSS